MITAVPTALNGVSYRAVRASVSHKMYDYAARTNGWTWKRRFRHTYACWQDTSASRLSSKSSTFLTFIFKVKYSNRVHWEVHLWLSHKWWPDRTNIATESRMWPFDWHIYVWSWPIPKTMIKVGHISTVNISETVTDMANIAIANKF